MKMEKREYKVFLAVVEFSGRTYKAMVREFAESEEEAESLAKRWWSGVATVTSIIGPV